MTILVIGGAGFIGRRMIPILVGAGQKVTCMDIDVAGASAAFASLGDKVTVVRGDVTQFDDVIGAVQEARAEKVVNLPGYPVGHLEDQSWWCGFGPTDSQARIVVCAIIENGGHGSTAAAPAALKVFEKFFGVKAGQQVLVGTD